MAILLKLCLITSAFAFIKEGAIFEIRGSEIELFHTEFRNSLRIIYFYGPTISIPHELNNIYFQAAKQANQNSLPIVFGKVEKMNSKNSEILKQYEVTTAPYLIYFLGNSDTPNAYLGPKTTKGILEYLQKKIYNINHFTSVEQLKDSLMEKYRLEGLVLGVFDDKNPEIIKEFIEFSYKNNHLYKFGLLNYTEDLKKDLEEEMNITSPSIVACRAPLFVNYFDSYYESLSNFESLNLTEWLRTHFHTQITFQTKDREKSLYTNAPLITLYMDISNIPKLISFIDRLDFYSKQEFKHEWDEKKYIWAIADRNEYIDELKEDGLSHLSYVYVIKHKGLKYVVDKDIITGTDDFNHVGIRRFYTEYSQKLLTPHGKNQKKKDEDTKENAKNKIASTTIEVKSKEFDEIVLTKDYSQLVFVYSDKGKLDLLNKLASQRIIEIVIIDRKNRHLPKEYISESNNALYFAEAKDKENPLLYTGQWDLGSIKAFLKQKKHKVDL